MPSGQYPYIANCGIGDNELAVQVAGDGPADAKAKLLLALAEERRQLLMQVAEYDEAIIQVTKKLK